MKKMMFALACASAVAAFAWEAPVLNAIGFDDYTLTDGPFTGLSNKKDNGTDASAPGDSFWLYVAASGSTDGSTVKAYDSENTGKPNYLELSTEGGTLWRSINGLSAADQLGAAQEVPAEGLYIDTMVQFTPTEDGGDPTLDPTTDKLAIWLNVKDNVTNLCVKAGFIDDNGTSTSCKPKTYILTGAGDINPATWYRLKVKSIADSTKCMAKNPTAYYTGYLGFQIYLNNQLLTATEDTIGSGYVDLALDAGDYGWLNETDDAATVALMRSKTLFPCLLGAETSATLQAVGFKGSGAIDSLQFTTQDPNKGSADVVPVTGVSLDKSSATLTVGETLTLNATVAPENASDTTVTWSVTDGGVVTVDGGVVTAVKAGTATVTVTTKDGSKTATCTVTVNPIAVTATVTLSPTTAEWAADLKLPTPTVTGAPEGATSNGAWDGSIPDANPTVPVTLTYTVTFTGNYSGTASATFTVTPQNKKYPTYISKDNQEAYDAWVSKYSVGDREDSTEALLDAFLLNVAPAEAEAEAGKFTITSITIDATGKVTVVAPAKNSKGDAFNGTVEVKGAATVDAAKYELKTTDPTARFFKAFLVLEAPAAK